MLSWSLARAPMGGRAMILHANWRPVAFSVASLTTEKPAVAVGQHHGSAHTELSRQLRFDRGRRKWTRYVIHHDQI